MFTQAHSAEDFRTACMTTASGAKMLSDSVKMEGDETGLTTGIAASLHIDDAWLKAQEHVAMLRRDCMSDPARNQSEEIKPLSQSLDKLLRSDTIAPSVIDLIDSVLSGPPSNDQAGRPSPDEEAQESHEIEAPHMPRLQEEGSIGSAEDGKNTSKAKSIYAKFDSKTREWLTDEDDLDATKLFSLPDKEHELFEAWLDAGNQENRPNHLLERSKAGEKLDSLERSELEAGRHLIVLLNSPSLPSWR